MCTVTFAARQRGYLIAMNRDEQRTRVAGQPPEIITAGGRQFIRPSEPGGGTWIALNDLGGTFALINWYSITARVKAHPISRGAVVNAVCANLSSDAAMETLQTLPLEQINPFRLIGIFPSAQTVLEWRWNLDSLTSESYPWETRQWCSSGLDEPGAQQSRGEVFAEALTQSSAGTSAWLRRLHCSHRPERGAYSICMHRTDATTVSYTEISVTNTTAHMRYHPAAPCEPAENYEKELHLNPD